MRDTGLAPITAASSGDGVYKGRAASAAGVRGRLFVCLGMERASMDRGAHA